MASPQHFLSTIMAKTLSGDIYSVGSKETDKGYNRKNEEDTVISLRGRR